LLAHLQGDGSRPPEPQNVTGISYRGFDSATGAEVSMVVLECDEVRVWDFSSYVWRWWVVGESTISTVKTVRPQLVLKNLPVGAKVAAQVYSEDWSVTGG